MRTIVIDEESIKIEISSKEINVYQFLLNPGLSTRESYFEI